MRQRLLLGLSALSAQSGSLLFGLVLCAGLPAVFLGSQLLHELNGVPLQATVIERQTHCSLYKSSDDSYVYSDRDCAGKALRVRHSKGALVLRTKIRPVLLYTWRGQQFQTPIWPKTKQAVRYPLGATVRMIVDPSDPTDIRRPFSLANVRYFELHLLLAAVMVAMLLVPKWLSQRLSQRDDGATADNQPAAQHPAADTRRSANAAAVASHGHDHTRHASPVRMGGRSGVVQPARRFGLRG